MRVNVCMNARFVFNTIRPVSKGLVLNGSLVRFKERSLHCVWMRKYKFVYIHSRSTLTHMHAAYFCMVPTTHSARASAPPSENTCTRNITTRTQDVSTSLYIFACIHLYINWTHRERKVSGRLGKEVEDSVDFSFCSGGDETLQLVFFFCIWVSLHQLKNCAAFFVEKSGKKKFATSAHAVEFFYSTHWERFAVTTCRRLVRIPTCLSRHVKLRRSI